jgi:hypothetical protein
MPTGDPNRRVRLTFLGESFQDGRVPFGIVASKIEALQNLFFHAAATIARDKGARRGQWVNRYRGVAELTFVESHHSDLVIEAELAAPAEVLSEEFDEGLKTLDLVFTVTDAVSGDVAALERTLPDRQDRAFMLRCIESLCPSAVDDYQVQLENCSARHPKLAFTNKTRTAVRRLVAQSVSSFTERDEVTIVGTLTKIHVEVGPPMIAVQVSAGSEIQCFYDLSMRDQIANLLAGSVVEVTGVASLDRDGRVMQLDNVANIEPVSMDPLRLTKFEHEGEWYKLKEPLLVGVEYADGIWCYSNPDVNLWGCAERREDAVRDLAANFAYVWREFALEDDANLDEKARAIKRKLLHIVGSPGGPV